MIEHAHPSSDTTAQLLKSIYHDYAARAEVLDITGMAYPRYSTHNFRAVGDGTMQLSTECARPSGRPLARVLAATRCRRVLTMQSAPEERWES